MTDRNDLERVAGAALRRRAFTNRGMLPPTHLADMGRELVGLLLDPQENLDHPAARMVARGLSFVSAQEAGLAVQQAALDAADLPMLAQVSGRMATLIAAWHKAELDGLRREQEDLREAVVRALAEQREESDRQRLAAERSQQEQDRLAALVTELSAPVIPLYDGILVLPLIGSIDTRRAQDVMENVLESISRHQADSLIIDITGVAMVDTGVVQHLLQTARAVGLLGATVVLVGINPEIAQTITQLGLVITEIITLGTLQEGIVYALRRRGLSVQAITAASAAAARQGTARLSLWR
ncbi:STAS domain-containing protein [Oscillochloris sp. ZM17-4]|uniref:STAS domain-containing protein n=1 Tax=Oscillochloris sp. ZM17-4 TaxID=2866714 RepID=UPI001C731DC0|nr:STAS domain-containing protein [Oscillochloris sp. ZM17-4]MBX0330585.1 STAS domain-containing protein [Oscillochloris sp. ZM17-4]